MNIYKSIPAIIGDIEAIKKTKKDNTAIKYAYRGIDEFMNALNPLLAKHKVSLMPEVLENSRETFTSSNGARMTNVVMRVKYTLYADDGTSLNGIVIGEGFDSGDKASNKAMSIALKYFIMQVFMVPTEDIADPDHEDPTEQKKSISLVKDKVEAGAEYNNKPISDNQVKRLWALQNKHGKSPKDIVDKCQLLFKKEVRQLNHNEYTMLCSWVEKGE